jgi:DNA adenine methylase
VDLAKVEFAQMDYIDYEFREGDVVYCDPPYRNTSGYRHTKEQFEHDQFWDWVRTRDYPVYVSEYSAPDDFVSIFEKKRGGL